VLIPPTSPPINLKSVMNKVINHLNLTTWAKLQSNMWVEPKCWFWNLGQRCWNFRDVLAEYFSDKHREPGAYFVQLYHCQEHFIWNERNCDGCWHWTCSRKSPLFHAFSCVLCSEWALNFSSPSSWAVIFWGCPAICTFAITQPCKGMPPAQN